MFIPEQFRTSTLNSHSKGEFVMRLLASVFNSVEAGAAVKNYLRENPFLIGKPAQIFLFGLGKAACAMTSAFKDIISVTDALVITKYASQLNFEPGTVIEGDHPVPGVKSLAAGDATLKYLSHLTQNDLLICLISGGGSALMANPRIPLADLQLLTAELLACGARIDEINVLRRHLDELKGGGLARVVSSRGARIISLLLSDVVDDSIEGIASGPTAPDPTTNMDALLIIEKYNLKDKIPASIARSLSETLKPNDKIFDWIQNTIVASNKIALSDAQVYVKKEGFQVKIIHPKFQGEASSIGSDIAYQLKESLQAIKRPFCLLAGGETTVTLKGIGKGGRNQELALAAVDVLADLKDVMLLSIATDGEDGPTDAAGAVVTGQSAYRAGLLGMQAADYLSGNDAYPFFEALDDLFRIGPSGTNVNDLVICFAF